MKAQTDMAQAPPDQLQREARIWVRLLALGKATQDDAQALRRWRTTSTSHEQAFVEAQRWWNAMNPAIAQLLSRNRKLADSLQEPERSARGRRAFLYGTVSAAAVAGVVLTYPRFGGWSTVSELRADYRTGTGEQRQVALADHVSVDMNTLTAITRQDVKGRTVGMELISGEAAVDLLAPRTSGFSVTAGVGRSVTGPGRFEVRYIDSIACVTCVQGSLRVEHPLGVRMLAARQQITYEARSLGEIATIDPSIVSAWRDGMLVFKQTPLALVIDEINRYRPGRVVLLNKSVSGRKVSGRFPVEALDTILLQIQNTYELHARNLPGGLLLLT
jgi:transmembrane sensor